VLGAVGNIDPEKVGPAAQRLANAYRDVPGLEAMSVVSLALPEARAAVVVLAERPEPLRSDTTIVWGVPVGAEGAATDDEIAGVLREPARVSELAGLFVLVRLMADSVRLVTSTDFVFTLRRSRDAFATRAMAAVALAGVAPRVERDAVVQAVTWQVVAGSGELLADADACEEGTLVDLTAGGVRTATIVPLGERLAPGPAPAIAEFRELLGTAVRRASSVPAARLALTAGRDSVLAASCLAEAGGSIPTYTLGYRGYPDSRGAHAVATALGWPHQTVQVRDARGRKLSRRRDPDGGVDGDPGQWLTRFAPWGEGLQLPRDALSGHIRWSGPPFTSLTGHSGEVGRAFYWGDPPDTDPVEAMVDGWPGTHLPDRARQQFRDAMQVEVQVAIDSGRGDAALDLVYVRRQRCWFDHAGLPDAPVANVLPQFLSAAVCRALINVPREQRLGSLFFDAALAADPRRLRDIAKRASAARRIDTSRLRRLDPYRIPSDWPQLHAVMGSFDSGGWLARDAFGDEWWQWALDQAPHEWWVRLLLWRAVGVEALHRWCG
jgi:hypothetical protein